MHAKSQRTTTKLIEDNYDVILFTDGACKGNPGVGGWGVSCWFRKGGVMAERLALFGGADHTTNNAMELSAAIEGLQAVFAERALPREPKVLIVTDSEYVKKGATEWINGWIKRSWIKADKKPVANSQLWKQLVEEARMCGPITWMWVKGHSGHYGNERADDLANKGVASVCPS